VKSVLRLGMSAVVIFGVVYLSGGELLQVAGTTAALWAAPVFAAIIISVVTSLISKAIDQD